ncbi:serine/threonine-protein kinase [Saccharothrix longispora]|uniref:non-specific serine/threonine protein kinase n=1 Tax=Saccharothrix longispora TaxID=33920 RepID=A0ABU1Q1J6_9PSEU|nr:serine/threonine-protein kinase [Saccharothrix longispora]MDR6596762.1 tRNA A-37 threonylcarbamoyl transferase component Bud32 [Saccharothrix longispora]
MTGSGGTVGGRYALVERVGSGAMGIVWRAHDELLDREVAVKQLRMPDLTPDEAEVARARAMREARNAARLHHPHAVALFDVVVEDGRPWLVMEHLPSRSLAGLLAEDGAVGPAETARIGGQVAAALAAAHAAGIVHRDVKPSNVLIGRDGTVKLTDFGISRATGDGTLTDSGMITGTPAYLAPEVARGEQPDSASDVFSLGATLYAATEGRSPYGESDNNFGLLYRAAAGRIEPPTRSGGLTDLLTRVLSPDPAERPTAAELVDLLVAHAPATSPMSAPKPAPGPEPEPEPAEVPAAEPAPGPRRRGVVAALFVAVLLVAGVVGYTAVDLDVVDLGNALGLHDGRPPVEQWVPSPADNAVELVRGHYEVLPEDPSRAYENLAESYRLPFEEYSAFWGRYEDVRMSLIEAVQDGATVLVRTRVVFVEAGVETSGDYELRVEPGPGRLVITGSQQFG